MARWTSPLIAARDTTIKKMRRMTSLSRANDGDQFKALLILSLATALVNNLIGASESAVADSSSAWQFSPKKSSLDQQPGGVSSIIRKVLTVRGGGSFGRSNKAKAHELFDDLDVDDNDDYVDDGYEYEYEYEYSELPENEDLEYEYYSDEDNGDYIEFDEDADVTNDDDFISSGRTYKSFRRWGKTQSNDEDDETEIDYEGTTRTEEQSVTARKHLLANLFSSNNDCDKFVDDDGLDDDLMENEYEEELDNHQAIATKKIPKAQPKLTAMKARKSSKVSKSRSWWQKKSQTTRKRPNTRRRQTGRKLSSRASFIAPPFYSGGGGSHGSLHKGSSLFTADWLSSLSGALTIIIRPMGNVIRTITCTVPTTISRWINTSWSLLCNTIDFMLYGPVDGVSTTGIATREGGLSGIFASTPITAMSSIVILGLLTVMISKRWSESGVGGSRLRADDVEDEELEFLRRDFDAANPSSKDRIAKLITKRKQLLTKLRRSSGNDRPKSRRRQRKFTIKSIQTWWKERPSFPSIAIIEPQHLRNQQQPLDQEVSRLQKQLTVSEQERAILQQDVKHLQDKLQRLQHEARQLRLGKNMSPKADQSRSMSRMEVERRKPADELGKERERMLLRDSIVGAGRNDLDMTKTPRRRLLDGVTIVREIDLEREGGGSNNGRTTWKAL